MRTSKNIFLLLLLAAAVAACAPRKPLLYQWGSYNEQIYAMYNDPGKVPIEKQLEDLERDYQRARAANRPVPPGYHAHVGYLYFQLGKTDQALQSFETEKALFPESTVYMDRLIARLKHG
jgi:hypothetical protein